jgi:hypothetical protein
VNARPAGDGVSPLAPSLDCVPVLVWEEPLAPAVELDELLLLLPRRDCPIELPALMSLSSASLPTLARMTAARARPDELGAAFVVVDAVTTVASPEGLAGAVVVDEPEVGCCAPLSPNGCEELEEDDVDSGARAPSCPDGWVERAPLDDDELVVAGALYSVVEESSLVDASAGVV